MPPASAEALPYRADSVSLFAPLASEPWALFLDSNRDSGGGGRFDIIAARPRLTLCTCGRQTRINPTGGRPSASAADPFTLLRAALARPRCEPAPVLGPLPALPFYGGAIGWFGYDLARRLLPLPLASPLPPGEPQLAVGLYDWALVTDHQARCTWLTGCGVPDDPVRASLRALVLAPPGPRVGAPFEVAGQPISNLDAAAYGERFARVQAHIRAGDCYQVNLARRFAAPARGDPWPAYLHLRRINPAPFAAFLNTPPLTLLCASPERFLQVRTGQVQTRPIKGTARRAATAAADRALAAALAASPKDRAENLMIVDLLRNDLGRCCAIGSVRVPELFAVESFAGLHHLVSTVVGRLAPGQDAIDLLRACLPGGSITGAPKRKTMEIIDALEGEARGPYCGSIAYLGYDGAMDSNIVIRTLSFRPADTIGPGWGELRYWAGGGLVADSVRAAEWAEIALKARAMQALVRHFQRR
ncbi:MAG: aminodeoxychorismate synthase component I [Chromatiaceae bacterium]|nr:MAG: aminodeoxychorismate synthase component I [Chromatiaceae bacterium]